jgi:hypothetical protein
MFNCYGHWFADHLFQAILVDPMTILHLAFLVDNRQHTPL